MSTIEELLADIEEDGITVDRDTIKMAIIGDTHSMNRIGYEYHTRKRLYRKAMAWFRLSALRNNPYAQYNIGSLYHNGEGVAKDNLKAVEWFLKAAKQTNKSARDAVAISFEEGRGVETNIYKALEWYHKSGKSQYKIEAMKERGVQLDGLAKDKPFIQLVMETDEILREASQRKEDELKEEIQSLKEQNTRMQESLKDKVDKIEHLEGNIRPVREYIIENNKLGEELDSLREVYSEQATELEEKDVQLKALETENASLRKTFEKQLENTTKQLENLEKSNHNLRVLLEQEKRVKENEIRLATLEVETSLKDGNMLKRKLEDAYRDIKKEMKYLKRAYGNYNSSEKMDASSAIIYNLEDDITEISEDDNEKVKTEIV